MTAPVGDHLADMMDNEILWLDALATLQCAPAFANDPIREVLFAESVYQCITDKMAAFGFVLPEIAAAMDDPMGFCNQAAAALRKFKPFLARTSHSPFDPIPPQLTVQ